MPDSPGTSAGAAVDELQGGQPSSRVIAGSSSTMSRMDSPAARLEAIYAARNSDLLSQLQNRSSEASARFNSYLGFVNEKQYNFDHRVFPDDLGMDHSSHYMIININVQVDRNAQARTNLFKNATSTFGPANYNVTDEASRVDQLRGSTQPSNLPSSSATARDVFNSVVDTTYKIISDPSAINLPRSTRKIKEAIALHMPLPTVYTHTNVYEEVSLTAFGAQALKLGATFFGKALSAGLTGALASAVTSSAPRIVDAAGNLIRRGAAAAGMPINPKIEVLFSHTTQRAFRMEILMAPKNENESRTVKEIIDTLRFHAAPEIDNLGFIPIFIPPAEFDITFYHKGKENTKIPRINTCALEQIEVDYAPTGVYSTFANGYPVAIRLSLAFRELEILHKQRVAQGF